MALKTGDKLHGFTVTRVRENSEIRGRMVEMTFDKTGTELVWIDNGEENKLFSICFRTLPENSTGVFHILEHSTLCGSKKYPVKEPFVELLKSSMNTFLNAITFSDKTMYPVSSRNDKDYLNLTEVYLDAVFAPRLLDDPNIFYQEGHHIEMDENGDFTYKGVVFNEMKGAMSGADRVINEKISAMLYPDTSYGFNSGGDPACIPDLTYEQFTETYRRFYHPSNARVFLDGNVPLEQVLTLLEAYFSPFDKSEVPQVKIQQPKGSEDTIEFEVAQNEPLENRSRLSMAKLFGTWQDDKTLALGIGLIADVLCGSNEAPLKRAVLESGLAQDISMDMDDSDYQSSLQMDLINIKDGCEDELRQLVFDTTDRLLEKGLDKEALTASLNRDAFRLREGQEPQGLIRCIMSLSGHWLFGGDPLDACTFDDAIARLRVMIEDGSLNELGKRILCDRSNMVILHAHPSYTAGEELRNAEKARLDHIKSAMTKEDIQALKDMNASLQSWQQTPDSPENLAKLPSLTLNDVSPEPRYTPTEFNCEEGVRTLFHPVNCHGIKHINLYFNISDTPYESLPALHFADSLFGVLPTQKYDALQLEQIIKNIFGRLNFSVITLCTNEQERKFGLFLRVGASVLDENLLKACDLLYEILFNTRFDCRDRIQETILQEEEMSKQAGAQIGHTIAMGVASAHFSPASAAEEALSGYTSLNYLHTLAKDFDGHIADFEQVFRQMISTSFTRSRLTVSVSGTENTSVKELLRRLPEGTPAPDNIQYTCTLPARLGLRTPAQISFASRAWQLDTCSVPFDSSMSVASNIISLAHLWNRVRVQGGAYGAGFRVTQLGRMVSYSYRDPTPARSLTVYDEMADFLDGFAASGTSLDNFIISTVSETEPLIGPRQLGTAADNAALAGITYERECELRRQLLQTTPEKLRQFTELLRCYNRDGAVCVVGHDAALKECELDDIFDL